MIKILLRPWLLLVLSAGILQFIPLAAKNQSKYFNELVVASRIKDHPKMIAAAKAFPGKMGADVISWARLPIAPIPMGIIDKQLLALRFLVLVLFENGGHHIEYSKRAMLWLNKLATDSNFRIDYVTNTDSMNEESLSDYRLIIQLDYAPYAWKPAAVTAFQNYIEQGKGGWIGFHHASLLGEFDGYPMWQWFSDFMGGIRWKNYIASFARATVHVEDRLSPVMKGVPDSFVVQKEEWYTYDKSPRPKVHVIASVDEASYRPDTTLKMGDHPVIWSNEKMKARNVYIFMGHSPVLFEDSVYKRIFRNAIFWAAEKPKPALACCP